MQRPHAVLLIAIIAVSAIRGPRATDAGLFAPARTSFRSTSPVLDRDHQPVRGLSAADFTVLDSGMEQPVVAFAAVDLPDRVRTGRAWDARRRAGRCHESISARSEWFSSCSMTAAHHGTRVCSSCRCQHRQSSRRRTGTAGSRERDLHLGQAQRPGTDDRPRALDGGGRAVSFHNRRPAVHHPGRFSASVSDAWPRVARRRNCRAPERQLPCWVRGESVGSGVAQRG
jgi:hypothetical protein